MQRGKLSADDAAVNRQRVTLRPSLGAVAPAPEVIVEAVPERLDLKRAVLRDAVALRPALLGSNTSSIAIGELAAGLDRPERFLGLHFFNPVWAMALLEIVVGPATAEETTAAPSRSPAGWARTPSSYATCPASPPPGSVSPSGWRRSGWSPTRWPARPTSTRRWCWVIGTRWGRWS
ncbi:hypothetical protein GCM10027614_46490 [Micromonospora vulcania]